MSIVAVEHILVVPTEVFHRLGHFQGFCGDIQRYLDGVLDPAPLFTHTFPLERLGDALDATRDRPGGFMKALVLT